MFLITTVSKLWSAIFVATVVGFCEFKLLLDSFLDTKSWIKAGLQWWYQIRKEPYSQEWVIYILQDGTETHIPPPVGGKFLKIRKYANGYYEIRLGGAASDTLPITRMTVQLFQIFYFAPGKDPVALDIPRNHWITNNDLLSREYIRYILQTTKGSAVSYVENYTLRAIDLRMKAYEIGPDDYIKLTGGSWTLNTREETGATHIKKTDSIY